VDLKGVRKDWGTFGSFSCSVFGIHTVHLCSESRCKLARVDKREQMGMVDRNKPTCS
jgi:hypothetical protein